MVVAGFFVIYGFPLSPYTFSKVCSKFKDEVYDKLAQAVMDKYPNVENETSDDEVCRLEDMADELTSLCFDAQTDISSYENHLDNKRFTIVHGSHYPRWTGYKDSGELFFGLSNHYSMDPCGKTYPFKDFSKKDKRELEEYCKTAFSEGEVDIEYHIYPDDCNCCS